MRTGSDWPVAFFDDDYVRIYKVQFTAERTRQEVDFIESALGVPKGAAVLDLACGFGRHAIPMAQRGYRMSGVDFNPRYLEMAAEEAKGAGVEVCWVQRDMRRLDFDRAFDAVYSYFTSFGYFSDDENERVLANVARALKPGGCFLLDMANRDWLLTHPQQRIWNQLEDGSLLMEEITLDLKTSRVISKQTLIERGGAARPTKEFELRGYTCAELTALLGRHGLGVGEVWGGADRSVYSSESRRLVMRAERSSGSEAR